MSTTPKVNVSVNFGDGTGEQIWSREDPRHLWVHQYQTPGFYWVSVSSRDIVHPYIYQYFGYFDFSLWTLHIFWIIQLQLSIGSSQCLRLDRGQREVRGGGGRPHCGQHGNGGEHDVDELRRWDQMIFEALHLTQKKWYDMTHDRS